MKKSALLVVDVQAGIFERPKPVYRENELIAAVNRLINAAKEADAPVVFIQHESSGFLKMGSDAWKLHRGLSADSEDIYIRKKEGNSFFETPLHDILQEKDIECVVVCGLLSPLCVQRTALGAVELGYNTILASDAHSNMSVNPEKIIERVHKLLERKGIVLARSDDIVF